MQTHFDLSHFDLHNLMTKNEHFFKYISDTGNSYGNSINCRVSEDTFVICRLPICAIDGGLCSFLRSLDQLFILESLQLLLCSRNCFLYQCISGYFLLSLL